MTSQVSEKFPFSVTAVLPAEGPEVGEIVSKEKEVTSGGLMFDDPLDGFLFLRGFHLLLHVTVSFPYFLSSDAFLL